MCTLTESNPDALHAFCVEAQCNISGVGSTKEGSYARAGTAEERDWLKRHLFARSRQDPATGRTYWKPKGNSSEVCIVVATLLQALPRTRSRPTRGSWRRLLPPRAMWCSQWPTCPACAPWAIGASSSRRLQAPIRGRGRPDLYQGARLRGARSGRNGGAADSGAPEGYVPGRGPVPDMALGIRSRAASLAIELVLDLGCK